MTYIQPSELEEINKLVSLIKTLETDYGKVSLEIKSLEEHMEKLRKNQLDIYQTFSSAVESNNILTNVLQEKYGNVTINLETGKISLD